MLEPENELELEEEATELEAFFATQETMSQMEDADELRRRALAKRLEKTPGGRPIGKMGGIITTEKESPSHAVIDPFPSTAYPLSLLDAVWEINPFLNRVMSALGANPVTKNMCIAVVDVLHSLSGGVDGYYRGLNDDDMLYVGSLQKISAMYAAFELRSRVQQHVTYALKGRLTSTASDWKRIQQELKSAWQPKLNKAFPPPKFPQGFPALDTIFTLSAKGTVEFRTSGTSLADLDHHVTPVARLKFLEWLKLMLRWSDNQAASNCILALSYPYINGVLQGAGFFQPASASISPSPRGLWISGNYASLGKNWLPDFNADSANAGQPKTSPSRIAGEKTPWATPTRPKTNFGATARKVAQLFALIAKDRLVDPPSSQQMRDLLSGAELNYIVGAGSFMESALSSMLTSSDKVFSKIGIGDDGFRHDAGIVERTAPGGGKRRYVAVVLGCKFENFESLKQAFALIHTCALARSPGGAATCP